MLENIRIVMVNTSHPGNIGAAARAMKNMGIRKLTLVDPKDFPSIEAYSRAASANDILDEAVVVATLDEAVSESIWVAGTSARMRTVKWEVLGPRACGEKAQQLTGDGEVALVFGRERTGLSNEELESCNSLIHIPTDEQYSSLNVAAAVQVLCYECRMAGIAAGTVDQPDRSHNKSKHRDDVPASAEMMQGMYQHLHQMLDDINFFYNSSPEMVMRRFKGLFNRANTTRREVALLRGLFAAAQGAKVRGRKETAE